MQSRLPEFCDLYQLADRQATVTGSWPVANMARLVGMLATDKGEAKAELLFGKTGKTPYVKGKVSATVEVVCQRCLDIMSLDLNAEFKLGLIESEAKLELLPDDFEPLVTEGRHFLPDVIEDELILALPIVPTHAESCSEYMRNQQAELKTSEKIVEDKKPNPFAVLKDLL
jgi:uncharacterized protein